MNRLLLALLLFAPAALMAQDTTSCASLEGLQYDLDGDMIVGVGDILEVLSWFGANFDLDQDDVLDCDDDCVGAYDECGICNGPGPQVLAIDTVIVIYDSVYAAAIDEWLIFELDRDTLLHLVCENPGCTDPLADNFDPYAEEGGTCLYPGFDCGEILQFDGHSYSTVLIGDQCWFAENLRTTTYADGTAIPAGLTDGEWTTTTSGATAVYGEASSACNSYSPDIDACDEAASLAEYGRLYNWYAVDDARGLCPSGWHVPTDGEWTDLEDYITAQGFDGTEGTALKSTYGWTEQFGGSNGTDDFGFSALPGGGRNASYGFFYGAGANGYWWSSSPSGGLAWVRNLYDYYPGIGRYDTNPRFGFSVRCLRDAD
jgi:uncharacterized protein (TIGR02145 family)